jgi:hypothetical protein
MARVALLDRFFGFEVPAGQQDGTDDGKDNRQEYGKDDARDDVQEHGEEMEFRIVGDRLVRCRKGCNTPLGAAEYAASFLAWLREKYPPGARKVLWVAARDLQDVLYPQFLSDNGWPGEAWQTVATELRNIIRISRSSCVEYLIHGSARRKAMGR